LPRLGAEVQLQNDMVATLGYRQSSSASFRAFMCVNAQPSAV
jgi:hypothetical protein